MEDFKFGRFSKVSQRHKLNRHHSSQPAWQALKGEEQGGISTPATQATLFQSPCALIKAFGASWQKANVASPLRKLCEQYEAGSTPIAESNTLIKALYCWLARIGL